MAELSSNPEQVKTETAPAPTEEEYEIEVGDDSPLSDEDLQEIATEASRLKLSKEDAQKLVALKEGAHKKGFEKAQGEYNAKIKEEQKIISSDPMFSENQKAQSFAAINRAVQAYGSPELVEALKGPLGNNLAIARFLKEIGDLMGGNDDIGGKGEPTHSNDTNAEKEILARNYPDFFKK